MKRQVLSGSFFVQSLSPSPTFNRTSFIVTDADTKFLGAFGAHPDHDAHLLSTLSAIQILTAQDAVDKVDVDRVVKCTAPHYPI